jgi:MHS family proline/betaine transporter-like MFS transporter
MKKSSDSPVKASPYPLTFSAVLGNILEWFDFCVFAAMSPYISSLFFPAEDHFSSLLGTFGAFAAGYFARPLGALIFGYLGDKYGSEKTLMYSLVGMGASTFGMACLATHEQIGVFAPLLLILLRIIQGICCGGEFTTAIVFIVENVPTTKRGFFGSWASIGCFGGFFLGSLLVTGIVDAFTKQQIIDWAWRLPFLSGLVILIFSVYFRKKC